MLSGPGPCFCTLFLSGWVYRVIVCVVLLCLWFVVVQEVTLLKYTLPQFCTFGGNLWTVYWQKHRLHV